MRESGGAAKVNFNIPGSLSSSYLHYLLFLPFIFSLCVTKERVNEEKVGRDFFVASLFDDTWTGGRENSHTSKSVPFCLQQPEMNSFFPLLSTSSLRRERMERVRRADTMSQSEASVSVREREGR